MREYLETFFRHKWLFFVPAITVLIIALGGGYYTSKQYESHATFWVSNTTAMDQSLTTLSLNQNNVGQTHLAELQGLMQTDAFVREVIDASPTIKAETHSDSDYNTQILALRKGVETFAPAANLVEIRYKDKRQAASYEVVEAIVARYQTWAVTQQQNDLLNTVTFLGEQYKDAQTKTDEANTALTNFEKAHPVDTRPTMPASDELAYQRLQSEYHAAIDRQSAIYDAQQKAQFSLSKVTASQKSEITVADKPTHPDTATVSLGRVGSIGLLGLAVGIGLGFTFIALLTWFGAKRTNKTSETTNRKENIPPWVDRLLQPETEM